MDGKEKGMVIVEATIVFPVMFLVIFLLVFAGNAYYQKCRIEAIVNEVALDAASFCASPMLADLERTGKLTEYKDLNIRPYRYLFGGEADVEDWASKQVEERVKNLGTGLFSGMKPENMNCTVKFNNKFIYSTFKINISYKVTIPVKLIGQTEPFALKVRSHTEVPVADTVEFMRNVNMIEDYMEKYGIMEKIEEAKGKVNQTINKMKDAINGGGWR